MLKNSKMGNYVEMGHLGRKSVTLVEDGSFCRKIQKWVIRVVNEALGSKDYETGRLCRKWVI